MMGYLGFFYVEAKAFEIRSEAGFQGIHLAKRSRGMFRAEMLGKPSVLWLRSTVEDLIRGTELKEFYRSFRSGSTVCVAQGRANGHGKLWSYLNMA